MVKLMRIMQVSLKVKMFKHLIHFSGTNTESSIMCGEHFSPVVEAKVFPGPHMYSTGSKAMSALIPPS